MKKTLLTRFTTMILATAIIITPMTSSEAVLAATHKKQSIMIGTDSHNYSNITLSKSQKKFSMKIKVSSNNYDTQKVSGSNCLLVNKKGMVTVKKNTKPGTYKMIVKIKAHPSNNYKYTTQNKCVKVIVSDKRKQQSIKIGTQKKEYSDNYINECSRKFSINIKVPSKKYLVKKISGPANIIVNKKGIVTTRKGTAPGTYKIKVSIKAYGNDKYKVKNSSKCIKIRIKKTEIPVEQPTQPIQPTQPEQPTQPIQPTQPEQPTYNTLTVYWTPAGSVYHKSSNCSSLSRSKIIISGSIQESGKERCCNICG